MLDINYVKWLNFFKKISNKIIDNCNMRNDLTGPYLLCFI